MSQQLFYGKIENFSNPIGNGSNSYIRVRFDAATNSTTLENVTDVTGYLGLANVRVGQQLVESSAFPSGVEITGVERALINFADLQLIFCAGIVCRRSIFSLFSND